MRLLHHYSTMSHYFLQNATRLFGLREIYRFIAVHASQRKKTLSFITKEKRCVSKRKKTAAFHNEKDRHVSQRSGLIRKY